MLKLIDKACFPLCHLTKYLRFAIPKKENGKIAVVKFSGMGETILTLPAIKHLNEKGYQVEGVVLKKRAGIVYEHCPFVEKVVYLRDINILKKIGGYQYAFDFELFSNTSAILSAFLSHKNYGFGHGHRALSYKYSVSFNDRTHVAQNYLQLVKELTKTNVRAIFPDQSLIKIPKEVEKTVKEWLDQWEKKHIIGIHASTEHTCKQRRWPFFVDLIKQLIKKDVIIILTGRGKDDEKINAEIKKRVNDTRVIDATNKFDFIHLCALLKHISIFISNDTGPMHLSALFNKNTIGLFGPNTPTLFGALGGKNIYHKNACPLSPCIVPHKGIFPECIDAKCMKAISVEEVVKTIEDML